MVFNCAGPVSLLVNQVGNGSPWLGVRLMGGEAPRDMLGAIVVLEREGALDLMRVARTGGSFDSASDPRILFGLAQGGAVRGVRVTWPSGRQEVWDPPEINRYHTLVEGTGRSVSDN